MPIGEWYIHWVQYCSPTKIPNRDKKTESPYLVHPLTYRQVYLTKDAYFVEKIHCELLVCLKITHLTWIWNSYLFNFCMNFPPCIQAFFLFYASWQEIRILVLFGWGKNARSSVVLLSIRCFRLATVHWLQQHGDIFVTHFPLLFHLEIWAHFVNLSWIILLRFLCPFMCLACLQLGFGLLSNCYCYYNY